MPQPFQDLGDIPSAKELLDYAFSHAKKEAAQISDKMPREFKIKRKERTRIEAAGRLAAQRLDKILEDVPKLDEIPPFYRELTDVLVNVSTFKKNLGAVNWGAKTIKIIAGTYARKAQAATEPEEAIKARAAAYGRISSVVKQISKSLDYLRETRNKLAKLPTFETNVVTIVVAGYANVGKSSFVKQISSAKPEVASYPFTTKEIMVGHGKVNETFYQVVDTPGLLDRPLKDRNKIELQAILALKHLASCIIFVVDPTETCGYPLDRQLNLYREIEEEFPDVPTVVALNKTDLFEHSLEKRAETLFPGAYPVSALKNEGMKEVLEAALSKAKRQS